EASWAQNSSSPVRSVTRTQAWGPQLSQRSWAVRLCSTSRSMASQVSRVMMCSLSAERTKCLHPSKHGVVAAMFQLRGISLNAYGGSARAGCRVRAGSPVLRTVDAPLLVQESMPHVRRLFRPPSLRARGSRGGPQASRDVHRFDRLARSHALRVG